MVNERLQPIRTAPATHALLVMAIALGLAAGTARAGQATSAAAPPPNKATSQTPLILAERTGKPASAGVLLPVKRRAKRAPLRVSGKRSAATGMLTAGATSVRTPKGRIVTAAGGRRDPFKAWEPSGAGGLMAGGLAPGALPPGTRGLVISQLHVTGIVRQESADKMIAVVTNYTKRAYFLKENDAVYNGVVSRITPDAVYFKENTLDSNGRVGAHDVVVKVGSTAGEGR
jgi:hypothetical protein